MIMKYKSITLLTIAFFIIFIIYIFASFKSSPSDRYSKSNDPNEYLTFELLDNKTYSVTGFKDYPVKDLVIPSTHEGIDVTEIGQSAFNYKTYLGWLFLNLGEIETVVIPNTIKAIRSEAFAERKIANINLPDTIEIIEDRAFDSEAKKNINIPKNIKSIGSYAFVCCNLANEIYLDNIELSPYALAFSSIKKVTFSDYYSKIPEGILEHSDVEELIIPSNCTEIENEAFEKCEITSFVFDENIEKIGENAFYGNPLTYVEFNSQNIELGNDSFGDITTKLKININGDIPSNITMAFRNSSIDEINIEENDEYCMIDNALCTTSKTLLLAPNNFECFDNIDGVASYAFYKREFNKLIIPENVIVYPNAFSFATINSLELYAKSIYENAFYYSNINEAKISTKLIPDQSFYDVKKLTKIEFLEGVEVIYGHAFVCAFDLETIYLPSSLKTIETGAFIQCHNLKNVYYTQISDELGKPADMYAGSFVKYVSNIVGRDNRIEATINPDLKIYIKRDMYDMCKEVWARIPTDEQYIYNDNLINHIEIIK